MRISDAERQEVVDRLGTALGEGRLDLEEYDDRVQSAYQAKTYRELAPLTSDLPGLPVPTPMSETRAAAARPGRAGEPPNRAIAVLSVVFVFIGLSVLMSVATGGVLIPFWPLFIFGFWGLARSGRYGRR
ncbi:MAG TPA: DUF1707 domain-containing protein [Actinocatenispora sp.]